jgi:hypothetical protein
MPSLFKTVGAVFCLVFAFSFAAPNAHADSFTYSYTDTFFGLSWTTAAIPAVTMQTTVSAANLTAASAPGCVISSVILDLNGAGATQTNCDDGNGTSTFGIGDGFTLSQYSTPGTYVAPNTPLDTLVVTAVTAAPEPSSLALMLSGVGLVFAMRKRWASGLQLAS